MRCFLVAPKCLWSSVSWPGDTATTMAQAKGPEIYGATVLALCPGKPSKKSPGWSWGCNTGEPRRCPGTTVAL